MPFVLFHFRSICISTYIALAAKDPLKMGIRGGDEHSAVKWFEERLSPNLTAAPYKVFPLILHAVCGLFLIISLQRETQVDTGRYSTLISEGFTSAFFCLQPPSQNIQAIHITCFAMSFTIKIAINTLKIQKCFKSHFYHMCTMKNVH